MANQSSAWKAEAVDIGSGDHTVGLDNPPGLYVGTSGNVNVTLVGGSQVTLVGMAAGVTHALQVATVHQTGTTASNMHVVEGR